jgi:hypothetical protein
MAKKTFETDLARLLAKTRKEGECLLYTGRTRGDGVPLFDTGTSTTTAQRAYLSLTSGSPLARNCSLKITCGNPCCLVHVRVLPRLCRNGHLLSENTTYKDKRGHTRCRRCRANQSRKRR